MASMGEDLRSMIVGSTAIVSQYSGITKPHACEQNTYPENPPDPRVYLRRASEETDWDVDGNSGLTESNWDLEVIGTNDDTVLDLAAVVKSTLDGHSGTFGNRTVQAVFVTDHDDEYEPRGIGGEDGFTIAAMRLQIIP